MINRTTLPERPSHPEPALGTRLPGFANHALGNRRPASRAASLSANRSPRGEGASRPAERSHKDAEASRTNTPARRDQSSREEDNFQTNGHQHLNKAGDESEASSNDAFKNVDQEEFQGLLGLALRDNSALAPSTPSSLPGRSGTRLLRLSTVLSEEKSEQASDAPVANPALRIPEPPPATRWGFAFNLVAQQDQARNPQNENAVAVSDGSGKDRSTISGASFGQPPAAGADPIGDEAKSNPQNRETAPQPVAFTARLESSESNPAAAISAGTHGHSANTGKQRIEDAAQNVDPQTLNPELGRDAAADVPHAAIPQHGNTLSTAPSRETRSTTAIESTPDITPASEPVSSAASTPLRDITFRVPGAGGVEVHLVERAGEVRVDVRTPDAQLTHDLRGNLRELVDSLEKKGLSASISHPGSTAVSSAERSSEMNFSKEHSSQSNGQDDAPDRRQQQHRQRQPDQPFEGRPSRTRETSWADALYSNSEMRAK